MNAKGGYLCNRLKYYRSQLKKGRPTQDDDFETNAISDDENLHLDEAVNAMRHFNLVEDGPENAAEASNENSELDLLQRNQVRFLKRVVVNNENIEIIKEKMVQTLEYRNKMIKDRNLDFRVEFPYFFSNPELVSAINQLFFSATEFLSFSTPHQFFQILFDFKIRYPNLIENVFKNFWSSQNENLRIIFNRFYSSLEFTTLWPSEIENLFILQRLFPAKNKSSAEVFKKAVDKLIIFKPVRYFLNYF